MGGFISSVLHGKIHWSSPAKLGAYLLDYYLALMFKVQWFKVQG